MEKWKRHFNSDNFLQRYKAKQLIEILNNVEPLKEFDMNLYFRIIEKMADDVILMICLLGLSLEFSIPMKALGETLPLWRRWPASLTTSLLQKSN